MNPLDINQTIQYTAWFLALAGLIVGLYVFTINPKNSANRYVGVFLLVSSLNTYAVGTMVTAITVLQATYSAVILASTTSMTEPLLLLTSVALLRPSWFHGKKKYLWYPVYCLTVLPVTLTVIDLVTQANLWFSGIDPDTYPGGFVISPVFTHGSLSWIVRAGFILSFAIIISILIYIALIDKRSSKNDRALAWLLLIQQFLAGAVLTYLVRYIQPSITILITNTIFIITYAIAAFSRMISGGYRQAGTLQSRLNRVVLIVTIPVMIASTTLMIDHARRFFEQSAYEKLALTSNQSRLAINRKFSEIKDKLRELAKQLEITSMDSQQLKPVLEQYNRLNLDVSGVGVLTLNGQLVARSGDFPQRDFSSMEWLRLVVSGKHAAYQAYTDNTFAEPTLVIAIPIHDSSQRVNGVIFSTSGLDILSEAILDSSFGPEARSLLFDNHNKLVISHGEFETPVEWGEFPPLSQLRDGISGPITYEDERGIRWRAKSELLPNGWGLIIEYPENELLGPLVALSRLGWISFFAAISLLLLMSILMIRHTIRPIRELSSVATAASEGDLSRIAIIESEDEIGELAQSFNKMTDRVKSLIGNLEQLVKERTTDLEQRAVQLQVAAEIAREAAAIHDVKLLLDHTANVISERFGFYHVGIFMIDDANQFAVLTAASSAGGHRMLARGHKLRVGKTGIVGHVASTGQPRIALDVGLDAVFFNNPDLPETRSEMALPLKAKGKVIGVLDVQSTEVAAFDAEDLTILQVLADQITLAIENARLLQKSEESLRELEMLYRQQVEQAWEYRLQESPIVFKYDSLGVSPVSVDELNSPARRPTDSGDESNRRINVPIVLRGFPIGNLELSRDKDSDPWSAHDIEVVKATSTQIALALENARLQEIERRRIQKEQLANEISLSVQSSLDLETVMKRAVQEIGQALKLEKVQIRLLNGDHHHQ